MEGSKFAALINSTLDTCKTVMLGKGDEYSSSVDRHSNFKRHAKHERGITALDILDLYQSKHSDSINTLKAKLVAIQNSGKPQVDQANEIVKLFDALTEPIALRIVDRINYDLLLLGLLTEYYDEAKQNRSYRPVASQSDAAPPAAHPPSVGANSSKSGMSNVLPIGPASS